jgi:hypothetical protein
MNKKNSFFDLSLLILFSLLFIIILFLFLQLFYFEPFLLYSVHEDMFINISYNFISNDLDSTHLNRDSISTSDRSSGSQGSGSYTCTCSSCSFMSSSVTPELKRSFGLKYKEAYGKVYNKLKNNINNKAKLVANKIKVFDRTLSWFFKGSKPGGGRGL